MAGLLAIGIFCVWASCASAQWRYRYQYNVQRVPTTYTYRYHYPAAGDTANANSNPGGWVMRYQQVQHPHQHKPSDGGHPYFFFPSSSWQGQPGREAALGAGEGARGAETGAGADVEPGLGVAVGAEGAAGAETGAEADLEPGTETAVGAEEAEEAETGAGADVESGLGTEAGAGAGSSRSNYNGGVDGNGSSNGGNGSGPGEVTRRDQPTIVDLHNKYRSDVYPPANDMVKMYWDEELARKMEEYINTCPDTHDSNEARKIPGWGMVIGQNLAWGYPDWESAVKGWHDEVSDFALGRGSINGKVVGHYTQMVQNKAARVGCAFKVCPGTRYKTYYGCNYAYGQSNFDKPYNYGLPCDKCRSHCRDNLCDCQGKICKNGGTLDLSTCTCTCAGVWAGDDCSAKNCPAKDPPKCGPVFPPSWCPVYYNVPEECPRMCGVCDTGL